MNTAKDIITYMESLRDDKQRANLMRFFKTAPGQYGEGEELLENLPAGRPLMVPPLSRDDKTQKKRADD